MNRMQVLFGGLFVLCSVCGSTYAATRSTPVTVVNTGAEPVPVTVLDTPAPEPMHHNLADESTYTVPPDRHLIIKYVSGWFSMTEGFDILRFDIRTTAPDGTTIATNFLPVSSPAPGGSTLDYFTLSQETYIYAPAGSLVSRTTLTSNPLLDIHNLVITGELVPIP